jgi:hypothetical protein
MEERDLSTAFADLDRDGFGVVEDVLSPAEVATSSSSCSSTPCCGPS